MKQKNGLCLLASALVLLVLPWLAVTFVSSHGGMAVMVLLLLAVDPLAAIAVGIFEGRKAPFLRKRLPVDAVVLLLLVLGVNPIAVVLAAVVLDRLICSTWSQLLLFLALFAAGGQFIWQMGWQDIASYLVGYLLLGDAAMTLTALLTRKRSGKKNQ